MKKDPKYIENISGYELEGPLSELVLRFQKILNKHPNARVNYDLDWGSCYYEGDTPSAQFEIRLP